MVKDCQSTGWEYSVQQDKHILYGHVKCLCYLQFWQSYIKFDIETRLQICFDLFSDVLSFCIMYDLGTTWLCPKNSIFKHNHANLVRNGL